MAAGGILLVCAANVCRSPMAELTLRRALSPLPGFEGLGIASAGVGVASVLTVCPRVEACHEDDAWRQLAAAHRSRALDPEEVRAASLVLTASRGIRSSVVAAAPDARRKVFTMREAVWLGEGSAPSGLAGEAAVTAFREQIDARRGLRQLPAASRGWLRARRRPHPHDIRDGHTMRSSAHRETIREVDATTRALAALIAAAAPAP